MSSSIACSLPGGNEHVRLYDRWTVTGARSSAANAVRIRSSTTCRLPVMTGSVLVAGSVLMTALPPVPEGLRGRCGQVTAAGPRRQRWREARDVPLLPGDHAAHLERRFGCGETLLIAHHP